MRKSTFKADYSSGKEDGEIVRGRSDLPKKHERFKDFVKNGKTSCSGRMLILNQKDTLAYFADKFDIR